MSAEVRFLIIFQVFVMCYKVKLEYSVFIRYTNQALFLIFLWTNKYGEFLFQFFPKKDLTDLFTW